MFAFFGAIQIGEWKPFSTDQHAKQLRSQRTSTRFAILKNPMGSLMVISSNVTSSNYKSLFCFPTTWGSWPVRALICFSGHVTKMRWHHSFIWERAQLCAPNCWINAIFCHILINSPNSGATMWALTQHCVRLHYRTPKRLQLQICSQKQFTQLSSPHKCMTVETHPAIQKQGEFLCVAIGWPAFTEASSQTKKRAL
mgnify:CR=1 FL=1